MNLKFMRRVSEREPAIRQFVIIKNKLMSVFYASVLLLIMNFVITLSKFIFNRNFPALVACKTSKFVTKENSLLLPQTPWQSMR